MSAGRLAHWISHTNITLFPLAVDTSVFLSHFAGEIYTSMYCKAVGAGIMQLLHSADKYPSHVLVAVSSDMQSPVNPVGPTGGCVKGQRQLHKIGFFQ